MHVRHSACMSGACLTDQGLALHKASHLHSTLTNCRARQRLAPHASELRCRSGAGQTTPGTRPALPELALHVRHGACFTHQKLALHKASHLHRTSTTCRTYQRLAPHASNLRCSSGAGPAPQGAAQLPRDLRCTSDTALVLPTRDWSCTRPAFALNLKELQDLHCRSGAGPAPKRPLALQVGGWPGPQGTTCTAGRGLARPPRDPTNTPGTCAARLAPRLHVQCFPYQCGTGLGQGHPLALHFNELLGESATGTAR